MKKNCTSQAEAAARAKNKELLAGYPELISKMENEDPKVHKEDLVSTYMEIWQKMINEESQMGK